MPRHNQPSKKALHHPRPKWLRHEAPTEVHGSRVPTKDLLEATSVIFRSSDVAELKIAEALHIKTEKPSLNNQKEGETRILSIF